MTDIPVVVLPIKEYQRQKSKMNRGNNSRFIHYAIIHYPEKVLLNFINVFSCWPPPKDENLGRELILHVRCGIIYYCFRECYYGEETKEVNWS